MNRKLTIENPELFKVLFIAFITYKAGPGFVSARLGRDILKKFEIFGEPDTNDGFLKMKCGGDMLLTQAEYERLEKSLEAFEYQPSFVGVVADTMDWFSAAEKM